jgi:hypothetical protein
MTQQTQLRRGTKTEHSSFTGAVGEVTVEEDTKTLKVHDGSTVGGHRIGNYSLTLSKTTAQLADSASEDWTSSGVGSLATVLSVTTDRAAWLRVYSSSAARTADTRTSPGGTLPSAGTGFLLEVATTGAQTLTLAPPAWWATAGTVYCRVVNKSGSTAAIALSINLLVMEG